MLTISGLTRTYPGGIRALDDVHLELGPGLFGLLGPNGAGKSSLMRTLAGLQPADRGTIQLGGVDVLADPDVVRRQLGYLPQDFGVYPGVSAETLLDHLAVLKGILDRAQRREQVQALLERVHLHEVRRRAVSTYSGGMRQRFGIAQALLGAPRLILLDEPTAGLDPEERARLHNLLSEVGEGAIVLLSTHIVEDVADLCPRAAILARGRVVRQGEPAALAAELRGRLWEGELPRERVVRGELPAGQVSTRLRVGRARVRVVGEESPGLGFEPAAPTLEDAYFWSLATAEGA